MALTIGVIGVGAMGSAVGARLIRHGATVLTSLNDRSAATQARAKAAGMQHAEDEQIAAEAIVILSIVPPAKALDVAQRFAARLGQKDHGAVFVDCNAVSISAVTKMAAIFEAAGARFVDGGIIGAPPEGEKPGPEFHVSGEFSGDVSDRLGCLKACGLEVRPIDGPVGAASALKLSYAGITKGLAAIGACMILAAERAGSGLALKKELAASQPQLLARFSKSLPEMYPKAYRWVDEMDSIADFIGKQFPETKIFTAAAKLYSRIAEDFARNGEECADIDRFLGR